MEGFTPYLITQTRKVRKSVHVPVTTSVLVEAEAEITFTPRDVTRSLSDDELEAEVRRRGYRMKGRSSGSPKWGKPDKELLDEARWLLSRNRVADALWAIELALPDSFRGFADEVARFYGQSRGAA